MLGKNLITSLPSFKHKQNKECYYINDQLQYFLLEDDGHQVFWLHSSHSELFIIKHLGEMGRKDR